MNHFRNSKEYRIQGQSCTFGLQPVFNLIIPRLELWERKILFGELLNHLDAIYYYDLYFTMAFLQNWNMKLAFQLFFILLK